MGTVALSLFGMDTDYVDRLNYGYTGAALLLVSCLLGIRQYFGQTIQCWIPSEFTEAQARYFSNKCWAASTYYTYTEPGETAKPVLDRTASIRTSCFQWALLVLLAQALVSYLPCSVWRQLAGWSGFDLPEIMRAARNVNPLAPGGNVRAAASSIDSCIRRQSRCWSSFLVVLYFIVKLLYLANCLTQLGIIVSFTGTEYTLFGCRALFDIVIQGNLPASGNLPRAILCDLSTTSVGQVRRYTFQCSLLMNSLLEIVFLITWLWFLSLAVATLISLGFWFVRLVVPGIRKDFVRSYLRTLRPQQPNAREDLYISGEFVDQYLRTDGVFTLRLMSANCGDVITGDVVCELFTEYRRRQLEEQKRQDLPVELRLATEPT